MGKSKAAKQNAGAVAKQQLHGTKNGSVKKNKDPKFKSTPMGKVPLINNSKAQNKNTPPQKNIQKNVGAKNNQNSPKGKAQQSKQNLPKGKQNSAGTQMIADKKILNPKKKLEEVEDSDSDIDEGIVPQEDTSLNKSDETFEDEEDSDSDVPDILGKSLKDESDEDDEDFEEEEEEDDDDIDIEEEMKRIKMFKGLKSKAEKNNEDEDDDEDDSDESADFNQLDNMESDEEDDDDEEDEDEEEDEDDDEYDNENINKLSKLNSFPLGNDEDDDDDDDDEEDEDEDEEEDDNSAPGLKALLDSNIADDDDDEDFNEEDEDDEDDDISDEDEDGQENENNKAIIKVTKEKAKASNSQDASKGDKQTKEEKKMLTSEEREEINTRTIIIDNIPRETKEEDIKKVFGQFGPINNIRISVVDQKVSKKTAALKKRHPSMINTTATVYVCFKSSDSAQKALNMNGKQFTGNYMSISIAAKSLRKPRDNRKAVFLGNLKFGLERNALWKHFGKCGEIESVQILHAKSGVTRGCGYINFKTKEAAMLALKLDGDLIMDRPVRVKPCFSGERKNPEQRNKRALSDKGHGNPSKKFKNISEKSVAHKPENEQKQHKKQQKNNASPEEKTKSFQGQKAIIKNKKKENKPDKKKKEMAKKLTAKPNKPVKV